jgi:hypothetical protein
VTDLEKKIISTKRVASVLEEENLLLLKKNALTTRSSLGKGVDRSDHGDGRGR